MSYRPSIIASDGRLWTWRPDVGYLPGEPRRLSRKRLRVGRKHQNKQRFYDSFEGLCGICGHPIDFPYNATEDHVVPRSLGGADYWNLVPAHKKCNNKKGSRPPTACELLILEVVNLRLREPDNDAL